MLLLTAVTFGGQDSVGIFDHLPDDEGEVLRHRASELLKIPREKRIPLLVQEIKRLVTTRRNQAWAADPEGLARVLTKERPALVEVVLRALPLGTADAVRALLPPGTPQPKLVREVKPQILHLIRWKLEGAVGQGGPKRPGFKFSDLLLLKSRELWTVCDRLGVRSLAQAFAGLPNDDREGLFGRLGPDHRQMAQRAATAAAARPLGEGDARTILALHGADKDPAEAIHSAGAQRLARACLAQSPEFAARIVERHPGPLGQLLVKWIREERPKVNGRIDGGRADVVAELDRLEQKGVIDRPVRLPPPPKPAAPPPAAPAPVAPSRASLPGGKLLVPARPSVARPPDAASAPPVVERDRSGDRPRPAAPAASSAPVAPHPFAPSPATRPSGERPRLPAPRVPEVLERVRPRPSPLAPSRATAAPPPEAAPVDASPAPSSPWRDPIAARQARRAGVPLPREPEQRRRDPIAEREARRAGMGRAAPEDPSSGAAPGRGAGRPARPKGSLEHKVVKARPGDPHVPEGEGEVSTMPGNIRRATTERPPVGGDRTSVQRSPRSGRPSGRGPRDGSG